MFIRRITVWFRQTLFVGLSAPESGNFDTGWYVVGIVGSVVTVVVLVGSVVTVVVTAAVVAVVVPGDVVTAVVVIRGVAQTADSQINIPRKSRKIVAITTNKTLFIANDLEGTSA